MSTKIEGIKPLQSKLRKIQKSANSGGGFEMFFGDTEQNKKAFANTKRGFTFFELSKRQQKEAVKIVQNIFRKSSGESMKKQLFAYSGRLKTEIMKRTMDGKDADGKPQRSYSPGYLKYRTEKGRTGNPVRLYFTGAMLRSIRRSIING